MTECAKTKTVEMRDCERIQYTDCICCRPAHHSGKCYDETYLQEWDEAQPDAAPPPPSPVAGYDIWAWAQFIGS